MKRRDVLFAAGASFAGLPAFAQLMGVPQEPGAARVVWPIDVVKILSFDCSFCRASEQFDRMIASAVTVTGGRFVRAPIPVGEGQSGWRERTYFAARDMDAAFGESVKQALYDAAQDAGVTLNDLTQLYYWLLQKIPREEAKFNRLFDRAKGDQALGALQRAVQLVENSGAQLLPTYVLLLNGSIQATLDVNSTKNGNLNALREEVISRVEQLSKPKS